MLLCHVGLLSFASSEGHDCGRVIVAASYGGDEPSDNAFHVAKTWGELLTAFKHAKIWTSRNEILKIHRYLI